jgi:homoaconitase/3-isopropylmalate dehydratase large subunit
LFLQGLALEHNVKEFGLAYLGMDDKRQGIVHIIGPENGFTLPGTTVVCGDRFVRNKPHRPCVASQPLFHVS